MLRSIVRPSRSAAKQQQNFLLPPDLRDELERAKRHLERTCPDAEVSKNQIAEAALRYYLDKLKSELGVSSW